MIKVAVEFELAFDETILFMSFQVGLYDVLSMKPPTISDTYHMKPVYAISWGPMCYPADYDDGVTNYSMTPWLYTCGGEGVIMMHPPDLV